MLLYRLVIDDAVPINGNDGPLGNNPGCSKGRRGICENCEGNRGGDTTYLHRFPLSHLGRDGAGTGRSAGTAKHL
jgi:hypothetical protein